ncbi:MAG: ABC transporter ATP-binding protein [Micavibrio sp.]|nr:MAG: ABC transporter ATP-binding protein [Micavibrio sp.]
MHNVAADYGQGNVVENVTFDVKNGETFGMMGLNGVGKTTLIKIMLGLMPSNAGETKIFNTRTLDIKSKQKLAYLPEKFEPPAFLTGMEFIRFSLSMYNTPFNEDTVLDAADRLALDRQALYRRVNTYSKGMKQKTGLLGTILTQCPLLILDEPMTGLDPLARACVKDEIIACRKNGMTIFLSSHILADMDEICDRVCIVHDRGLRFLGTPKKLKQDTKETYLERAFLKKIGTEHKEAA